MLSAPPSLSWALIALLLILVVVGVRLVTKIELGIRLRLTPENDTDGIDDVARDDAARGLHEPTTRSDLVYDWADQGL